MASSLPAYWSSEACAARATRFGRFLVIWRSRCKWSQYEIPKWADAAGFVGPAVGTVSQLERGRVSTPTMALFAALAEVNRRLVAGDFSGVVNGRLMERLKGGVPVVDRAGNPWGFHQFVSAFHVPDQVDGEIWEASGASSKPAPAVTAEELERVNNRLADGFRAIATQLKPLSRALRIAGMVAPPGEREAYEEALGGLGYEKKTLERLWDSEAGDWAPLVWLQTLEHQQSNANGGGVTQDCSGLMLHAAQ